MDVGRWAALAAACAVPTGLAAEAAPTARFGSPPGGPSKPRVATNSVYMDRDHPSALVLPVVYLDAQ